MKVQRLQISHVTEGKGAFKAGLLPDDVIESYCGLLISSNDDLGNALQDHPEGGVMAIYRDGDLITVIISQTPLGVTTLGIEFDPALQRSTPSTAKDSIKLNQTIAKIIITTTPSLDGYRIVKVVDVISAECVFGMNIFKDFFTGLTDFFGGRSETSQKVLREAREKCIHELRTEAHRIGANAVIGVDLDYSEFSGQGKSMLFLVASGTAVTLEKIEG